MRYRLWPCPQFQTAIASRLALPSRSTARSKPRTSMRSAGDRAVRLHEARASTGPLLTGPAPEWARSERPASGQLLDLLGAKAEDLVQDLDSVLV